MNFSTYLSLVRLRLVLYRLAIGLNVGLLVSMLRWRMEPTAGGDAFLWWTLLVPVVSGYTLSRIVQHAVQPFHAVLPNARRNLLRQHLPLLGVLALTFGSVGSWVDPDLPWFAAVGLASLGLAISLPLDSRWRWARSRVAALVLMAGFLAAMLWPASVREFALQLPWVVGTVGFAATAWCCRISFPIERLERDSRRRSEPHLPLDPQVLEIRGREALARSRRIGRRWTLAAVRSRTDLIRAVLHEAFGFRYGWSGQLLLVPLVFGASLVAGLAVPRWLRPSTEAHSLADLIYATLCNPAAYPRPDGAPSHLLAIPLAILIVGTALPPIQRPYPISRRRRARLTFGVTVLQATVTVVLVLATLGGLAWIAAPHASEAVRTGGSAAFLTTLLPPVPLLPWAYWVRIYFAVRPSDKSMHALLLLGGMLALMLLTILAPRVQDWHLSVTSLAVIAAATVVSLVGYHRALLNFYTRGDLLQRSTSRHNLSLV